MYPMHGSWKFVPRTSLQVVGLALGASRGREEDTYSCANREHAIKKVYDSRLDGNVKSPASFGLMICNGKGCLECG